MRKSNYFENIKVLKRKTRNNYNEINLKQNTMSEFKYYIMKRKSDQAYPLLRIIGRDYSEGRQIKLVYLEFNSPIPRKPVMADFLSGSETIVSKRIADAMQQLNMDGVQFIPTKLTDTTGNVTEDYVCVVVKNNTYLALDKDKAKYRVDKDEDDEDDDIYNVSKVVLDREVLGEIPLNKRLGFRLKEAPGYSLYHQSVVDVIMALEPTGLYFRDIEDYELL